MPRRRGAARGGEIRAEVNVTSLVDVALTLLVIFIITAPMLQGGVEVDVPRADTRPLDSPEGVVVSIDREGAVYIGDRPTGWTEFREVFPGVVREAGAQNVYLRADHGVPYGRVVQVLAAMKGADVASVGLVAEPEEAEAR